MKENVRRIALYSGKEITKKARKDTKQAFRRTSQIIRLLNLFLFVFCDLIQINNDPLNWTSSLRPNIIKLSNAYNGLIQKVLTDQSLKL